MSYTKDQILFELRNHHTQLLSFADALDTKLNGLTQAGMVILSVFAVVGTSIATPQIWFWIVLAVIAILYMGGAIVSAAGLTPQDYAFPLKAEWNALAGTYFGLEEADMRDTLISQYIAAIDLIKPILATKATYITVGTITLSVAVTAMIILLVAAMVTP